MYIRKALFISAFLVFGSLAFANQNNQPNAQNSVQQVTMPDYHPWDMVLDHAEAYLHGNDNVNLRDQHYVYTDPQNTERQFVIVFYRPENNKPWFAVYIRQYADLQKSLEAYLFEANANEEWSFAENESGKDDLVDVFKSRYNLIPVQNR